MTLLTAVGRTLAGLPSGAPFAVALSAGPDSSMLAVHAAVAAADAGRILHCFHIHHGLQADADEWLIQAHRLAGLLSVSCHTQHVVVRKFGRGLEAAAREARYAALVTLAAQAGVRHVLLAHHQDDQAETVLLRLLRGSGPLGLAAMAPAREEGALTWLRPWLAQPRQRILTCVARFVDQTGWQPVQDPSNTDVHYRRGVLREEVAPLLDRHWPAWRRVLARHADQARDLHIVVEDALQGARRTLDPDPDGLGFSLQAWRQLAPPYQGLVLRDLLARAGVRMPTQVRLDDWLRQLRTVHALGHDRQVTLPHEGGCLTVRRGRVRFERAAADPEPPRG